MKGIKESFLDMLKLRGSYGTLGNQNTTSCYPYYQQMKDVGSSVVINGEQVNIDQIRKVLQCAVSGRKLPPYTRSQAMPCARLQQLDSEP